MRKVLVELPKFGSCEDEDNAFWQILAKAQIKVGRSFVNGSLIEGTEETALVRSSKHGIEDRKQSNGLFDFMVLKSCEPGSATYAGLPTGDIPSSSACLDTQDPTGKICYSLQTSQGSHTGAICVEMKTASVLQATFSSAMYWSLLKGELWVGSAMSAMPVLPDKTPDHGKFPNFWSNSSGETSWTTEWDIDFEQLCMSGRALKSYVVAHALVGRVSKDGAILPGPVASVYANGYQSQELAIGFEVPIQCGCSDTNDLVEDDPPYAGSRNNVDRTVSQVNEANSNLCFRYPEGSMSSCFALLVADRAVGGSVCLELDESLPLLKVTYKAISTVWTLIKNVVWVGFDPQMAPEVDVNDIMQEGFPSMRVNSLGDSTWTTSLPLNATDACADRGEFDVFVLAYSLVGRVDEKGRVMKKTPKHPAFTVGPSSTTWGQGNSRGVWLTVKCNCAKSRARRMREFEIFPHTRKLLY